ncbi:MAG: flagella basal body P-ring formation protein FlgA [Candidatus Pseudothioglobus sp.]|jgi:flagella basal body P-ring formation protein FlgA
MSQQRRISFQLIIFCALWIASGRVWAIDAATPIQQQVQVFIENVISRHYPTAELSTINVQKPDIRLDLTGCQNPDLSLHNGLALARRVLVKVDCDASMSLHLPVDLEIFQSVLVAATALNRHAVLDHGNIRSEAHDVLRSGRHYLTDPDQAVGQRLKRSIGQGTLLTPRMLLAEELVSRGDDVMIRAQRGALVVRMHGTAMASGGQGDQIKVKNVTSSRIISAQVSAAGEVTVDF